MQTETVGCQCEHPEHAVPSALVTEGACCRRKFYGKALPRPELGSRSPPRVRALGEAACLACGRAGCAPRQRGSNPKVKLDEGPRPKDPRPLGSEGQPSPASPRPSSPESKQPWEAQQRLICVNGRKPQPGARARKARRRRRVGQPAVWAEPQCSTHLFAL